MGGRYISVMLFSLFAILLLPIVAAEDQVVINSKDWRDTYSGMIYSKIIGVQGSYLIEETRVYLLLDTISSSLPEVLLVESPDQPFVKNFENDLEAKKLTVEKLSQDDINLELARRSGAESYIVMDDRYSYNAVSIAPYASFKKYYVIFANTDNIDEVTEILDDAEGEIIVYGYVDREVTEALSQYSPTVINKGNKYSNNLEVVKRFTDERKFTQYVLTNGDFLEPQFFAGMNPVVFIGRSNIPDEAKEFLKQSEVKHGIIIGNELVDIGTTLKSEADMKIMVKFAKGVNNIQYSLDTLALPQYDLNPVFRDIVYNQGLKQLIVTVENVGTSPGMIRSTYTITNDGESIAELGDEEAIFLAGKSIATLTYDVDLTEYSDWGLMINARMIYGEEIGSLDNILVDERDLNFDSFEDNSEIEILDTYYDESVKRFVTEIKNTGRRRVYVQVHLAEIVVNNREETLSSEVERIKSGDSEQIKIKARLTKEDIEDNDIILVKAFYGESQDMLLLSKEKSFEFMTRNLNIVYIAGAAVLLIIILIILLSRKKKRHHGKGHIRR